MEQPGSSRTLKKNREKPSKSTEKCTLPDYDLTTPKTPYLFQYIEARSQSDMGYIDREGHFWITPRTDSLDDDVIQLPYPEYDFYYIGSHQTSPDYSKNSWGGVSMDYFLLGKPREQNAAAYISQMPTTGAPDGLSSVGLVAVGLGLMGVALGLMRRRSF